MRKGLIAAGVALGVLANAIQVISWIWVGSRQWVDGHGLLISGASVGALALVVPFVRLAGSVGARGIGPSAPKAGRQLVTYPPYKISISPDVTVDFVVHYGPIDRVQNVDIIVSSENTYLQMSQMFKPSTSGRLRYATAEKDELGRVLRDTAQDELISWMRDHDGYGDKVTAGTVVATSAGSLAQRGIRRIYHAAVVQPEDGSGLYRTNKPIVAAAVERVLELARKEIPSASSVCFPLLGAGRAGLSSQMSLEAIYYTMVDQLREDPSAAPGWTVHFISWRSSDAELIRKFLRSKR